MTTCVIDLGQPAPCALTLRVIPGEAWVSPGMTRSDGEAWTDPPRLAFTGGQSWVAGLSPDGVTATITASAADTAAVTRGEMVALRTDTTVYGLGYVRTVDGVPT